MIGWNNITYQWKWESCTFASNAAINPVLIGCLTKSTANSYTVQDSDVGLFVGVEVIASENGGITTTVAWTGTYGPIPGSAPVISSVLGLAAGSSFLNSYGIGTTLQAPVPIVTSHPPNPILSYQWFMCSSPLGFFQPNVPDGCSLVTGATQSSFRVSAADEGLYPLVDITATNPFGSGSIVPATLYFVASPPINTVAPTVTLASGGSNLLSVSDGTWSGNPAPSFLYEWYWCYAGTPLGSIPNGTSGQNCWPIAAGNSWTYDPVNFGRFEIVAEVLASNIYSQSVPAWAIWNH